MTLRSVGTNGGQVATFAFDLARSVIATRQGNLAWAGQDRDGATPNRSNDLFFGGSRRPTGSTCPRSHIPQADEQQRLLANLVTVTARDRFPVPRFWYFPGTHKAVVVGHRRRPRHWRHAGPLQHLRRGQPVGLLGGQVGVPALHVLRLPEHADDQRPGCVVQQPGVRGRPPPARTAAPTSRRTSPSQDIYTDPARRVARDVLLGCPRPRPAASTASSGATGSPRPRPSSPRGSGSTPTTTTTPARGSPTGPAS